MTHAALPSPAELGFPPKFTTFYDDQIEAIDRAVFNPKRFTALAMPTGSGKSVTGIATALLHQKIKRAIYLTSTKGLQDQLSSDFQSLGVHDLRGAKNYPCRAIEPGERLDRYRRSRYTAGCDEGPCHSGVHCPYKPDPRQLFIRPDCAYYGAVWDARHCDIVSTNYAMYLASEEYTEGLGPFDALILDEAHDADKELEAFLAIEVTVEDAKYISTKLLKSESLSEWRDWALHHKGLLGPKIEARAQQPPADIEGLKDIKRLKRIKAVLDRLAAIAPLDWILDLTPMRAKFAPTKVSAYAEKYLFRNIPHVLLMSATMTPKTLQLLGIARDDAMFWECPSRFPIEHRPIVSINTYPSVRVDHRMHESTKALWVQRIDRIIEPRIALGWNGIIHTVSYIRMKELLAMSAYRDRFIVHDAGNTREQIQYFKAHPNQGLILVSPSVVTGYDFPDDQCRFQIIGKVPQPDMSGPIMSVRKQIDKEYSGYLAMQKLVQACGRGVRGPEDWCETFIVDDHFADWFLDRYKKHAPRWFKDAVYYVDTIPQPFDLICPA
jgi:ATP-dependent DNA helicase DinG